MSKTSLILFIGWLGGVSFAFCGAPQAIQVIKQGHAEGIAPLFIGLWALGEVCTMFYVYKTRGLDGPLFFNYTLNLAFISVILYYMI